MTFEEFRIEFRTYRDAVDKRAIEMKQSNLAWQWLLDRYDEFYEDQRLMADKVLIEWVLSEEYGLRCDALVLIKSRRIVGATSALGELSSRISQGKTTGPAFEAESVKLALNFLQR
ncbi:MAG TPA: hypothetical protein VHZ52_08495 [Acidobacteriaceae bacterium]|jgi:hypothetical protein|nr:hypothetical protein [Acidobacteriaceae bacterium]